MFIIIPRHVQDNYLWPILAMVAFPQTSESEPGGIEVYASVNGMLTSEEPLLSVEYKGEEDVEKVYKVSHCVHACIESTCFLTLRRCLAR